MPPPQCRDAILTQKGVFDLDAGVPAPNDIPVKTTCLTISTHLFGIENGVL
jgi:hypothetical protein